jgi:hypothetical protein
VPFVVVLAFAFVECIGVASKWWLTYWGTRGNKDNQVYFLSIYGAINVFNIVAVFFRLIFIMILGLRASRKVGVHALCVPFFFSATWSNIIS